MPALWRLLGGLRALVSRGRVEQELSDELRQYLDAAIESKIAAGMRPEEARRAARADLGSLEAIKDNVRDVGWEARADAAWRDLRYALRALRSAPAFTTVAVFSFAVGLGANAAIFSIFDAVLLKSLPVREPQRLVVLASHRPDVTQPNYRFTYELFEAAQDQARTLAGLLASAPLRMHVGTDATGATVPGQLVSGSYFATLGVRPSIGRLIGPSDDAVAGGSAVAIISDAYWQRQFGSSPDVVGRTIELNGYPFTIVGVTPRGFFGTRVGAAPDITVPLSMQVQVMPEAGGSWIAPGSFQPWLELIGRLRPEVTAAEARAELDVVFQRQMELWRSAMGVKAAILGRPVLRLEDGSGGLSELRRRVSRPLAVLMGMVGLVLLIACANVANLMLARGLNRRREIALRISLGAGRTRVIAQLVVESLVIAGAGGLTGLLLAIVLREPLGLLFAGAPFEHLHAPLDARVIAFTLAISALTGIVVGVLPAFTASAIDPHRTLKDMGTCARGYRLRGRRWLVAAQVAVSLVLIAGAGLFVRTLINLKSLDIGMDTDGVLAVRLEPRGSNQKRGQDGEIKAPLMRTYETLLERVRALPGVRSASLGGVTPIGTDNGNTPEILVPGYTATLGRGATVRMVQVYPGYFETLGVRLIAGRDFTDAENATANGNAAVRAAVVNQAFAARFFGGAGAAIGRHITFARSGQTFNIVGVSGNLRDQDLRRAADPVIYGTYVQTPSGRGQMTLLVRVAGDVAVLSVALPRVIRGVDSTIPAATVETIAERAAASLAQDRVLAVLSAVFGLVAVLLASVGLYGVVAYTAASRRSEFGLRMALGATRRTVMRTVLSDTLWLTANGIAIGVPAALAATRVVSSRLFGIDPNDTATLLGATLLLVAVSLCAGLAPAFRAARTDPLRTLRAD